MRGGCGDVSELPMESYPRLFRWYLSRVSRMVLRLFRGSALFVYLRGSYLQVVTGGICSKEETQRKIKQNGKKKRLGSVTKIHSRNKRQTSTQNSRLNVQMFCNRILPTRHQHKLRP